ncbi:MAG: ribosome small subunit-dependent GTPase A [Cyclobacteriaceae bacterium]|nr:ribosome small subunit-dependent GTPase A [Cyclobacteriaceae bacterium]
MKGLVMRSTGSWYDVLTENNTVITARMRGKFRLEGIKETNPIAVGDRVVLDSEHNEATIIEILDRENYVVRQSVKKANQAHVIAANIDQAMIVATLKLPRTSTGFIDRFLVAAESFRIPQVVVFNKKDLLSGSESQEQAALIDTYRKIGVTCIETSALNESQEAVRALLEGKVTLLSGHSGVGKSTLLNKIAPEAAQKTSEISDYSEKGTHTTTFAEMFRLNEKTFIIDTPGIKEFGLIDMSQEELSDYFPEMRDVRLNCKFGARCLHLNEPKCAVLDAVKRGEIAETRYASYFSMVMGEDNRK